jgi:putative addiction module component (TIGR02574 family)
MQMADFDDRNRDFFSVERAMSPDMQELRSRLKQLDRTERADLARYLIDSLGPNAEEEIAGAWERELDRRLEELKEGPAVGVPAEEVLARVREKYT